MAKVKVTANFYDKYDPAVLHKVGEVFDVEAERAKDIESRSLGLWLDKPAPQPIAEQAPQQTSEEPKAKAKGRKK